MTVPLSCFSPNNRRSYGAREPLEASKNVTADWWASCDTSNILWQLWTLLSLYAPITSSARPIRQVQKGFDLFLAMDMSSGFYDYVACSCLFFSSVKCDMWVIPEVSCCKWQWQQFAKTGTLYLQWQIMAPLHVSQKKNLYKFSSINNHDLCLSG